VRTYAFLGAVATDYLTGLRWPVPSDSGPGGWLGAEDATPRGYRADQLVWWLDEALWEIELAGEVHERGRSLVAERGRLLSFVAAWSPEAAYELIADCALRLREAAVAALGADGRHADAAALETAADLGSVADAAAAASSGEGAGSLLAGYTSDLVRFSGAMPDPARGAAVAARIAAHALAGGDERAPGYEAAYAEERRRQADWLRTRLGV
jgi:hypothetical protein